MEYNEFLLSKRHSTNNYGIEPIYLPDSLFDYQKYVAEHAIKKGREAVFLDTGLGKTIIQLVVAHNYAKHTNKPVLIITPLAVAFQFIKENERFGICDISHSKDGKFTTDVVVCNYERLQYFNPDDFDCVLLDESSILKNFDGATKTKITSFLKRVKYRYLFTATPAPNDYIEFGTSSEALGYLPYMDMLERFFANNENNIRPQEIGTKWYLKPHAKDDFFAWVKQWSINVNKPSDIGFSDENHILPNLIENVTYVKNINNWIINGQVMMFNGLAKTMSEVREEQKNTINERCEKAVELASQHDTSVYWCNFNDEGVRLSELDKDAYEVKGSMSIDKKEELLLAFSNGEIKKLITKPKITSFGLNWQHCNHTVFFPTWSYEQYYQAIRRFWRFGQKDDVVCDLIVSDGQKRVIDALEYKKQKANDFKETIRKDFTKTSEISQKEFDKDIILPSFLNTKQ